LTDFGLSTMNEFDFPKATSTRDYLMILSPERIIFGGEERGPFTEKSDVYR